MENENCPKCGRSGFGSEMKCLWNVCRYRPYPTQEQSSEERMKTVEKVLEDRCLLKKIRYCVAYTILKDYVGSRIKLGVVVWVKDGGRVLHRFTEDVETFKRTENSLLGRDRAEKLQIDIGNLMIEGPVNPNDPEYLDKVIPRLDDFDLRFTWPSAERIYPAAVTDHEILAELFQEHVQNQRLPFPY